ncbi:MAG TPA: PEP-CTERM sorting domain-containing protein [Stellaceae bacterium]|nr:PEP-CTERM sorting domain-containing protein [Stellaceae bacterium]
MVATAKLSWYCCLVTRHDECEVSALKREKMRAAVAAALIMGVALLGPQIARAAAVTRTYTLPSPLLGYTSANGASFTQFDPALGTLQSITLHATATATWSGGTETDFNDAEYAIFLSGFAFTMDATMVGNGSAAASANFTDAIPTVLSALTGSDLVDTSVSVINRGGTPATISSTFGTESVTYNYEPSVPGTPPIIGSTPPVPEPSSLSILAVGLLGLGWLSRRRLAPCRDPVLFRGSWPF